MSELTKKALARALREQLEHKPLSKITVSDVTDQCGVNRKTFYYHFQDLYALLEWIYTTEAIRVLDGKKDGATWQQGFLQILEYMRENRALVQNTYHSLSRELLEQYLYREMYQLLRGVVDEKAGDLGVSEADRASIAHFYKYAFVGLVLDWVQSGLKSEPEQLGQLVNTIMEGSIQSALERFAQGSV